MTAQRIAAGPPHSHAEDRGMRALDVVLALALSILLAASPAVAEDPPAPPLTLTVAILDPAEVPELAPWFLPEELRASWRATFGSERETQHEPSASFGEGELSDLSGVDAVLIQSVYAAAPLRRLFPPRTWRLIISRNILGPGDPGLPAAPANRQPGAAVAVRVRKDLSITGLSLTFRLPKPGSFAGDPDSSAAAVRLATGGRTFWLGSITLPASCSVEDPPCDALETLDAWREDKRKRGEPALIGERLASQTILKPEAEASSACASFTIESDLVWQRISPDKNNNSSNDTTRCVSVIRISE